MTFLHLHVWNKTNIFPHAWILAWALRKCAAFFYISVIGRCWRNLNLGTVWLPAMLAGVITTRLSSVRGNKKINALTNTQTWDRLRVQAFYVRHPCLNTLHWPCYVTWANKLCAHFLPPNTSRYYTWGEAAPSTFQKPEKCCAMRPLSKHWALLRVSSHMWHNSMRRLNWSPEEQRRSGEGSERVVSGMMLSFTSGHQDNGV